MIYWDTSAIVPLYVEEPTTAFWESQLKAFEDQPKSGYLAVTEFSFALRQKVLLQSLGSGSAEMLIAKFADDCAAGHWLLLPMGLDVIEASLEVSKISYGSTPPVALRSLDGLHLGAARVLKCNTIATGDARLAAAAASLNFRVLSPK